MKHFVSKAIMFVFFLMGLLLFSGSLNTKPEPQIVTILHTNDLQSRLLGFGPNREYSPGTLNDDDTIGGFARLATLIKQRRQIAINQNEAVLLLDGGDFSMGTLFHTITKETGSELQLMQMVGYDAIAIGNHEFDFDPDGLAQMIISASKNQSALPQLLMANLDFDSENSDDDRLADLYAKGIIRPWTLIEKNGLKIAIIGLMGDDAWKVTAKPGPLKYHDPVETVNKIIKDMKQQHQVDLILLCSHGGVDSDDKGQNINEEWEGEDIELARQLPEVNAVIGGHSHTPVFKPRLINGNIPVLQAGSEARFLGELKLTIDQTGQGSFKSYELHPVNDQIPGDPQVTAFINQLKKKITQKILKPHGLDFNQPIVETSRTLTEAYDDQVLGNLIAEAIRQAGHTDIGITTNGLIRDQLSKGRSGIQSVSDVFRLAPLGSGPHSAEPGYPLTRLYVTGAEIKSVLEVLSFAYRSKGNSYYPRFAGLRFEYNPWRMPLDTVYKIEIGDSINGYKEINLNDDQKLYSIALTTYIGGFVSIIEELSKGIHSVTLKDKDGNPIAKIEDAIIDADPGKPGIQEIKEWIAIIEYLRQLPDTNQNGIADVPNTPAVNEVRMVSKTGFGSLFRNASLTWIYLFIPVILILVAVLIHRRMRKSQS